jgi:hypothetical protein
MKKILIAKVRLASACAIGIAAKLYINKFIFMEYGEMLKLEINSLEKKVYAEVLLKGESEHVFITGLYSVSRQKIQATITLREITTSKAWMDVVIKNILNGEISFPINNQLCSLADLVI